jgi:hypothetical protein
MDKNAFILIQSGNELVGSASRPEPMGGGKNLGMPFQLLYAE